MAFNKLIFICEDNATLGPMAQAIFEREAPDLEIDVISRGMVVLFSEPTNLKASVLLEEHDLTMPVALTVQFSPRDVNPYTLLVTMNKAQKRRLATDFKVNDNVYTLAECAGSSDEIKNPYGKGEEVYEETFKQMEGYIKEMVKRLKNDIPFGVSVQSVL